MASLSDFRALPKVELHDHLDGGLRPATLVELSAACGAKLPLTQPDALASWFKTRASRHSLPAYLEGFAYTVAALQTAEALERVAFEALEDLAADGVVYAELRYAPSLSTAKGLTEDAAIEAILAGLARGKKKTGLDWGFISCAMRNAEPAVSLASAKIAVAYKDKGLVGFDLAGPERGFPCAKHAEAFDYAAANGLGITLHAGEADGLHSVKSAIETCHARRIGHGTRLVEELDLPRQPHVALVKKGDVAIECCLSSNLQTRAAESLSTHPFPRFRKAGLKAILGVDNRLMSATTLSDELMAAADEYDLGLADLEAIQRDALAAAFCDDKTKASVLEKKLIPGFKAAARLKGFA